MQQKTAWPQRVLLPGPPRGSPVVRGKGERLLTDEGAWLCQDFESSEATHGAPKGHACPLVKMIKDYFYAKNNLDKYCLKGHF